MKLRHLLSLCPSLCVVCVAQAPPARVTFTAGYVQDGSGNAVLPAGALCVMTVDGNNRPMGYRIGGGGQTTASQTMESCFPVVNGAIAPQQIINSAASSPLNALLRITTRDSTGAVIRTNTGVQTGVTAAMQTWCSAQPNGTVLCNWDQYPVGTTAAPITQVGPAGTNGTNGRDGAVGCPVGATACNGVIGVAPVGNQHVAQPVGTSMGVSVLNGVYNVDEFCSVPGTYDQTCLTGAVSALMAANLQKGTVQFAPHDYLFTNSASFSGLSNVKFRGQGESTTIKGYNMQLFNCDQCTNLSYEDFAIASTVTPPTVVTPAQLPTADPNTRVLIDRFGTGVGYSPTENDGDLIPQSGGGTCTAHCLQGTQWQNSYQPSAFLYDVTIGVTNSTNVTLQHITSTNGGIRLADVSGVTAEGLHLSGSQQLGCLAVVRNNSAGNDPRKTSTSTVTGAGNFHVKVSNSTFFNCSYEGLLMMGEDFALNGNIYMGNGESGAATSQGDASTNVTDMTSTGGSASFNWYDGVDFGMTFPHTGSRSGHYTVTGMNLFHNGATGGSSDANDSVWLGNNAYDNRTYGLLLDISRSVIALNRATNNALGSNTLAQIAIDVQPGLVQPAGSNVVSGNVTSSGNVAAAGLVNLGKSTIAATNQELTSVVGVGAASDGNMGSRNMGHGVPQLEPPFVAPTGACALTTSLDNPASPYTLCFQPNVVAPGVVGWRVVETGANGAVSYPITINPDGSTQFNAISVNSINAGAYSANGVAGATGGCTGTQQPQFTNGLFNGKCQ